MFGEASQVKVWIASVAAMEVHRQESTDILNMRWGKATP